MARKVIKALETRAFDGCTEASSIKLETFSTLTSQVVEIREIKSKKRRTP